MLLVKTDEERVRQGSTCMSVLFLWRIHHERRQKVETQEMLPIVWQMNMVYSSSFCWHRTRVITLDKSYVPLNPGYETVNTNLKQLWEYINLSRIHVCVYRIWFILAKHDTLHLINRYLSTYTFFLTSVICSVVFILGCFLCLVLQYLCFKCKRTFR